MTGVFVLFVGLAALFVWWSSGAMPESVASHFGPGGVADGFTSRELYARFMVALVLLLPSVVLFTTRFALRLPVTLINLPNKAYWLAPERRRSSLESLGKFGTVVACAMALLLCLVHWMAVQANRNQPPRLDAAPLITVVGMFFAVLAIATGLFVVRFFRVP
jgi:hypothetical protein